MNAPARGLTVSTFPKAFDKFVKRIGVGVYPKGVTINRRHKVPVRILYSTDRGDLAKFHSLVRLPGRIRDIAPFYYHLTRSRKHADARLVASVRQVQEAVDKPAVPELTEDMPPVVPAVRALWGALRKQALEGNDSSSVTLESGLALVGAGGLFARLGDPSAVGVAAEVLQQAAANPWIAGKRNQGDDYKAIVRELALEAGGTEAFSDYCEPVCQGWADALPVMPDLIQDPIRIYQGFTALFAEGDRYHFGDFFTERALEVYGDAQSQMEYSIRDAWFTSMIGIADTREFEGLDYPFTEIGNSLRRAERHAPSCLSPDACVELGGFAADAKRIAKERGE